ncbi:c-type cytochrome biogenesis protein CcmI [Marinobacter sp. NP-4(2019)]|uniref:c-type cytochrome biogenesis protein CcmI n=1 Tax=Marinobacter sp. NP-4(2019) TaxID=2488665 RepID=UPI000FC3D9C2|nr:c-type cytochrome biogenesis protein CcmI [Marinobacter sp. NP-4(2019)]AZT84392.1 c-type cytochrome biogenesis protein CcmI [Marinobacter sp. NP-4(2019)]
MTNLFWIIAAALIILALAFIIWPLFFHRSEKQQQTDLRNQNLMAYRSRMAELENEYQAGILDQENYQQLRDELAGSMLDDVPDASQQEGGPATGVRGRKSSMAIAIVSIALIPAAAVFLYQQWGAMDDLEQYLAMQEMIASDGDRVQQMNQLTAQLRERLEANPDNADGWAMLGRSYMRLERYEDAAWAFERLAEQVGDDDRAEATAWGLSAQALFFNSQGALDAGVTRAIEKARALNPDEVNALGLLGISAFSQQNYEDAIGYWERIVEAAPDHPQIGSIRQGISEAYQRLGREAPKDQRAPVSGPGVTVRIELSEAFAGEVPGDTTLFVFARKAGSQGAAPLAVARLSAGDLPAEIRLDDRNAMSPDNRLSDASEVLLVARLSRSGNAMPQAGDWQGELNDPVTVSDDQSVAATLVIDHQLRN